MTNRATFVCGSFLVLCSVVAACGERTEQIGTLSMKLRTEVNGVSYRLRDAVFQVTGQQSATINTEDDPDALSVQRTLPSGNYTIDLQDGWRLEKQFSSGFQTVAAQLVTVDPRAFSVTAGGVSNVAYGFMTDGTVIGFGDGNLELTINVNDTSNTLSIPALVGNLDGRLIQMPCLDMPGSDDCAQSGAIVDGMTTACAAGQLNVVLDHPIAGTPGTTYLASLHFYGIVESKNYGNNERRESGTTRPSNLNAGATPPPWYVGVPGQTYLASTANTYEIRVFDQNNVEVGTYFANSDTAEGHFTYVLNFVRTIPIVGGGSVRIRMFDSNCRQIKNCGTGGVPCASKARTVDISGASPQPPAGAPPAGFTQPGMGHSNENAGQWFLVDVTNVQAQ